MKSAKGTFAFALLILAVNLFGLTALTQSFFLNSVYIVVRLGTFFALSYFLVKAHGFPRPRAVALTALAAFVEQVIFKGALLARDLGAAEAGAEATPSGLVTGLITSFVVFAPFIVVIALMAGFAAGDRTKNLNQISS